jgi:hypothetical protein
MSYHVDFRAKCGLTHRYSPLALATSSAGPKLKDFKEYVDSNKVPEIEALAADVEAFARGFPTIGFEKSAMRYPA